MNLFRLVDWLILLFTSSSSISFSGAKRHSLMGLDNDPQSAAANGGIFGGKVMMRYADCLWCLAVVN